ncbi:MAG: hypothetical protein ACR2RF_01960 [Geminicoccaceae bacterium]
MNFVLSYETKTPLSTVKRFIRDRMYSLEAPVDGAGALPSEIARDWPQ